MTDAAEQAALRETAVEVARAILRGEVGIIEGSQRLTGVGHTLVSEFWSDPDFKVFGLVDTETDHLPIGRVRALWDPNALKVKDVIIERVEAESRVEIEAACRSIILRYQDV